MFQLQNLLKQAEDDSLPDQLIDNVNDVNTVCIKRLICKTSPFIWAAQKSLKNRSTNTRIDLISWIPSKTDFENNSDICDDKYDGCNSNLT